MEEGRFDTCAHVDGWEVRLRMSGTLESHPGEVMVRFSCWCGGRILTRGKMAKDADSVTPVLRLSGRNLFIVSERFVWWFLSSGVSRQLLMWQWRDAPTLGVPNI